MRKYFTKKRIKKKVEKDPKLERAYKKYLANKSSRFENDTPWG